MSYVNDKWQYVKIIYIISESVVMEQPTRLSPLDKVQLQIQNLQNKVAFLTEENKQLKQTVKELKKSSRPQKTRDTNNTA